MGLAEELGASRKKFQAPVRVAVTGRSVGPPLFESMERAGAGGDAAAASAPPAQRLGSGG